MSANPVWRERFFAEGSCQPGSLIVAPSSPHRRRHRRAGRRARAAGRARSAASTSAPPASVARAGNSPAPSHDHRGPRTTSISRSRLISTALRRRLATTISMHGIPNWNTPSVASSARSRVVVSIGTASGSATSAEKSRADQHGRQQVDRGMESPQRGHIDRRGEWNAERDHSVPATFEPPAMFRGGLAVAARASLALWRGRHESTPSRERRPECSEGEARTLCERISRRPPSCRRPFLPGMGVDWARRLSAARPPMR
jgi:hypothetical protein